MNYTLNQLRIFMSIVKHESITKAADELHLTQPAVSIQLKNFQQQFDIALTEVIHKRLYITDFGREIALAAENILNEVYAINYKTMAYKGQLSGRLKISVVSTGKYVIPYFLTEFLKLHKGVDLVLDVTNRTKVVESLLQNEIDFALMSMDPEINGVNVVRLMKNKLFMFGKSDLGIDWNAQNLSEIQYLPLIYREAGSATRLIMEKYIAHHQVPLRRKMELTSNEAVKQAVLAGLGFSVMPLVGLKNELALQQIKIIPLDDLPIISAWHLVWLEGKRLSPVAKAYHDFITTETDRIVKEKFSWLEQY
jgi:LysR family transcriptional regulator, low CO2-responsive transcriptional regulator